jgi:hypothetical protein
MYKRNGELFVVYDSMSHNWTDSCFQILVRFKVQEQRTHSTSDTIVQIRYPWHDNDVECCYPRIKGHVLIHCVDTSLLFVWPSNESSLLIRPKLEMFYFSKRSGAQIPGRGEGKGGDPLRFWKLLFLLFKKRKMTGLAFVFPNNFRLPPSLDYPQPASKNWVMKSTFVYPLPKIFGP